MVQVESEIGRLESVLVHEPGPEVDLMVPAMMEELLFDDILYGERAREEHGCFRRVLQLLGVEVLEAADLLAEALSLPEAREWIFGLLPRDLVGRPAAEVEALAPHRLAETLIRGMRRDPSTSGSEVEDLYEIPPLPNWCFQRDPQVVLGAGVILCSMAAPARHREALLSRVLFRFHPRLREIPVLFDPLEADRGRSLRLVDRRPSLEGGDLLVLSKELLVVGRSERTNGLGIRALSESLARVPDGPRWLIVVEIPRKRAYMHLDTLITPVDREACLVFPPVILPGGAEEARVHEIDLRSRNPVPVVREHLLDCLAAHGHFYEPIPCGGEDPVAQQRDQWTDGANAFALGPGLITLYDRNIATADELARRGFRVIGAEELLLGRAELDPSNCGRACILLPSHEISRARGGPHCLTQPLRRRAV